MTLGPAPVLALLLGVVHVSLYVLIRGSAGRRLPWLVAAAFLGAWAGDALAGRLGLDPLRIGDFHVIGGSLLAWVGIAAVAVISVLGPEPPKVRARTRAGLGQAADGPDPEAEAGLGQAADAKMGRVAAPPAPEADARLGQLAVGPDPAARPAPDADQ